MILSFNVRSKINFEKEKKKKKNHLKVPYLPNLFPDNYG